MCAGHRVTKFALAGLRPVRLLFVQNMSQLLQIIIAMRPKQWTKNLLLFAGLVFTHHLLDLPQVLSAVAGFFIFCGLSGVVYLYNDLRDVEGDRQHPLKCSRPIAAGKLSPGVAWVACVVVAVVCLAGSCALNARFAAYAWAYFIMMILYSAGLKHVVILDLMIVALGFVVRAMAGVRAVETPGQHLPITPWFITCVLFLALFIVICKRRHEVVLLADSAANHRPVLEHYSTAFLDQMVSVATSATVISYALYVVTGTSREIPESRKEYMIWTLPFVLYGVFRYLYLVYRRDKGGSPETLLLQDVSLLVNIGLWLAALVLILY